MQDRASTGHKLAATVHLTMRFMKKPCSVLQYSQTALLLDTAHAPSIKELTYACLARINLPCNGLLLCQLSTRCCYVALEQQLTGSEPLAAGKKRSQLLPHIVLQASFSLKSTK